MKINYAYYHFSSTEMVRFIAEGIFICILVNYLCYRETWAFIITIPFIVFYLKWKRKILIQKRRDNLRIQFATAIHTLQVALTAGYSMESAVSTCLDDLRGMYEEKEAIVQEFLYIKNQLRVNVPIEVLFADLANRSQIEDIQNFASVYAIAKRSGGNLNTILSKTTQMIEEKIETGKEIQASIAAKQMEQMIMSIVPCGIILYVQLTSPGFMDTLYGNMVGVVVMTGCLFVYCIAFYLGKKITEVEV